MGCEEENEWVHMQSYWKGSHHISCRLTSFSSSPTGSGASSSVITNGGKGGSGGT